MADPRQAPSMGQNINPSEPPDRRAVGSRRTGPAVFSSWLRSQGRPLAALTAAALLAGLLCSLYRLPPEPFWYGLALCGMIFAVSGWLDFRRFMARLDGLTRLARQEDDHPGSLTGAVESGQLPPSRDGADATGDALIRRLARENRELREANRLHDKELSDAITLWTHQIKTPIAAARLLLQADGKPGAGTPEQSLSPDTASELTEQLFRIENYADMALQVVRVADRRDLAIHCQPIDPILRRAVREYAGSFIRRGIAMDYAPCPGEAVTDGKWLGFAFGQVLSNALKYTPPGGRVTIRSHWEPEDGGSLRRSLIVTIADDGMGIDPADLPRIFEKGFTGYNGRAQTKATGLGLYLCRQMMDVLGHRLAITSSPGTGTTVAFTLDAAPRAYE